MTMTGLIWWMRHVVIQAMNYQVANLKFQADAIFPNDKELLRRVKDKYKPLLESGLVVHIVVTQC